MPTRRPAARSSPTLATATPPCHLRRSHDSAPRSRQCRFTSIRARSTALTTRTAPPATILPLTGWPASARSNFSRKLSAEQSLRLDAGRLDDRPPSVGLGLAQRAKRFGCLLGTWRNDLAKLGELAAHRRIGERGDDGRIERRDRLLRCPLWHPHGLPERDMKAG